MHRFKNIFMNISYTLSSNFLVLLVATLVTLLLPKVLGFQDYGYYQLYLFYTSYVAILHLGWCDGVYLRYGGESYANLDKNKFKGQFISLVILQILITLLFTAVVFSFKLDDQDKVIVLLLSILNIFILNSRAFLTLVLQATNRMRDYSVILISDRIIFIALVVILLLKRVDNFEFYILADLSSKFISLIVSMIKTKEITYDKNTSLKWDKKESILNIKSGINIVFANFAGALIIGTVRFGIQNNWSVGVFGKVSLTLSISNMLMVFVNAISLAIFPILKRVDESKYRETYSVTRTLLMPLVFLALVSYYPITFILSKWLPQYIESLRYAAIVFPIVVFEAKVSLLTNTYLKAIRKEKSIFKINFASALLSLVGTFISVYLLDSLFLSVISIVILLGFRSCFSEIELTKYINISVYKDMFIEIIMVLVFIFSAWNLTNVQGLIIYFCAFVLYLIVKRKDFFQIKKFFLSD